MADLDAELANFEAELASLAAASEQNGAPQPVQDNETYPSVPPSSAVAPPPLAPPPIPPPATVVRPPAGVAAPTSRAVISAKPAPATAAPPAPGSNGLVAGAGASGSSSIHQLHAPAFPAPPVAAPPLRAAPAATSSGFYGASGNAGGKHEKVALLREAAGKRWVDTSLLDWPDNDYRIFVGNLGNEVNDTILTSAFQNYGSFNMARVVRNGWNKKSKGFGFASFSDPIEGARVLKEMQGAYVGNRPVQLKKSTWDDRQVVDRKTGKAVKRVVEEKERKPEKKPRQEGFQKQYYHGRH